MNVFAHVPSVRIGPGPPLWYHLTMKVQKEKFPDTDELADDLSQAVKLLFKFVEQVSGCDCSVCHEAVGNLRKFVGLS